MLGEWKSYGPNIYPLWHGFGACYIHGSEANEGRVYIGELKDGKAHGSGKLFWLESAPSWKENRLSGSSSVENGTGLPYVCSGTCDDNRKEDESATVTLKDGTTRVGPWKSHRPVGGWWKDHKLVTAATTTQQDDPSALAVKLEEPTTMPTSTASTRVSRSSTAKQPLQQKSPPREASVDEQKPSARPVKRAKRDHASVNPPQVISLNDSDDNDAGDQAN